jgi:chromosomal replication initiation ATPase DnaA
MDGLATYATMPILDLLELPADPVLRTHPFESVKEVKRAVARHFKITMDELEGPCRKRQFAHPRQIAMALSYRRLRKRGYSLPMIGRCFGNRDRTTVLYAFRKFNRPVAKIYTLSTPQIADIGDWLAVGGELAA